MEGTDIFEALKIFDQRNYIDRKDWIVYISIVLRHFRTKNLEIKNY